MTISIDDSILSPDFLHIGIVVSEGPFETHGIFFDNGITSLIGDVIAEYGKLTSADTPEGQVAPYGLVHSNIWTSNQIFLNPSTTPTFPVEGWCLDDAGNKKIFTVVQYFTVPASPVMMVQLQSLDSEERTVISAVGAQQIVELNFP